MSDPDNTEDRLRLSLHSHADAVQVEPDSSGLFERTARDSVHRRRRLGALSVIAVVLVGAAGVLGGQALASSGTKQTTASLAPESAAAPSTGGPSSGAAIVPSAPLNHLFTRTTGDGITIRAYVGQAETAPTCENGCTPAPGTTSTTGAGQPTPTSSLPVPKGAGASSGTISPAASTGTGSLPVMTVPLTPVSPVSTTTTVGAGAGTTSTTAGSGGGATTCTSAPVTIELSTDAAVTTATAAVETPVAGQLVVEASGVFGTAEGNPASWVLVATGSDVASVRLGGAGSDTMTPVDGLAVLAVTGSSAPSVVALDPNGVVLASVPATVSSATLGCAVTGSPPPSSTTVPSTVPPGSNPGGPVTTIPIDPPVNSPPGTALPLADDAVGATGARG
jgi:hypothetical protein